MSKLYSSGALNQLGDALEKAGFSAGDVTKLKQFKHLKLIKSLVQGKASIVVDVPEELSPGIFSKESRDKKIEEWKRLLEDVPYWDEPEFMFIQDELEDIPSDVLFGVSLSEGEDVGSDFRVITLYACFFEDNTFRLIPDYSTVLPSTCKADKLYSYVENGILTLDSWVEGYRFVVKLAEEVYGAKITEVPRLIKIDRSVKVSPTDLNAGIHWHGSLQDKEILQISEINLSNVKLVKGYEAHGLVALDFAVFLKLWQNQYLIPEAWKGKTEQGKAIQIAFSGTVWVFNDVDCGCYCLSWDENRQAWCWKDEKIKDMGEEYYFAVI